MQVVDEITMESYAQGSEDAYPNIDLERALDDLPTIYRSVIVLRFFEENLILSLTKP